MSRADPRHRTRDQTPARPAGSGPGVASAGHPPLIDLGEVGRDISTVRRGGLDPSQVRAALAAKDRQSRAAPAGGRIAEERAATATQALKDWQSWHRGNCLGPTQPGPIPAHRLPNSDPV